MELVSEKLSTLYNREEEIKKLIEKNKKKLDICTKKLVDLKVEKDEINQKLKLKKVGDVIDVFLPAGSDPITLGLDVISEVKHHTTTKDLRVRKKEINMQLQVILNKKRQIREDNQKLKEELTSIKEEIRSL